MILAIRSDKPETELYLCEGINVVDKYTWPAHRVLADTIHLKIKDLLVKNGLEYKDLTGLLIYKGPGSFTGLRIGAAVFNTIAYIQNIPIIGTSGDDWLQRGLIGLNESKNDKIVDPYYGADANISTPKK